MRTGMGEREGYLGRMGMGRVDAEINLASGFCNRRLVSCSKMRIVMLDSGANAQHIGAWCARSKYVYFGDAHSTMRCF
jgi:hypothetical protein